MAFTIYHPADLFAHPVKPGHPERSHRLTAALASLCDIAHPFDYKVSAPAAPDAALLLHSERYIAELARPFDPGEPPRMLDGGDTIQGPGSLTAALRGLGAVQEGVDALASGTSQGAFVLNRPAGHHATADHAMGFCLLGVAALAAKHAQVAHGMRVAVLDIDLHHGNGTQDLLWNEKEIFFASTHEDGIFPMTGHTHETGAHGQIMNRPLPQTSGGPAMREAWTEILAAVRDFAPDLIVISAGFDAHLDDPLSKLRWGIDDFAWLGEEIATVANDVCAGKTLSILEGGYDLSVLRHAIPHFLAPIIAGSGARDDAVQTSPVFDGDGAAKNASPYLAGNVPIMGKPGNGRFACVKANTRLWIQDQVTGAMLYTPPEFLRMQSRQPMQALASAFEASGKVDIEMIIAFEHQLPRQFGYTQRSSADFAF